jgi:hypothetical protein
MLKWSKYLEFENVRTRAIEIEKGCMRFLCEEGRLQKEKALFPEWRGSHRVSFSLGTEFQCLAQGKAQRASTPLIRGPPCIQRTAAYQGKTDPNYTSD